MSAHRVIEAAASPAMERGERVWLADALGEGRPTPYALSIVALCMLAAMVEGYDTQTMAFAAPLVRKAFGLSSGMIGVLLMASIAGTVAGNFLLSPLGDHWGRRRSIVYSMAFIALATAAGAVAPNVELLLLSRVAAGIGLGLALPIVVALPMEVMPRRLHGITVVVVSCGYPLGGVIGGLGVSALIGAGNYDAIFLLGAVVTALVCLLCQVALPESPLWMARRSDDTPALERYARRLGARLPAAVASFALRQPDVRSPVRALFTPDRRLRTLLLWLINFASLLLVYLYMVWLPSILVNAGHTPAFAAIAFSYFSAGGIVGAIVLGIALRRLGAEATLSIAYVGAIALLGLLATSSPQSGSLLPLLAAAAATIVGGQFCLVAVINQYYPSTIRATAAGYATGAGRLGGIVAPLAGALVVRPGIPFGTAIAAGIAPAAVALIGLVILRIAAPVTINADK